jgi:hypothetical protein
MTTNTKPLWSWTIAYRTHKNANHFKRVANWSGTWSAARVMAVEFEAQNPGAEVWYVPTAAYEDYMQDRIDSGDLTDFGYSEDFGNILMASGKRIRMRETGSVTDEMVESVAYQVREEDQRAAMDKAATQNAIDTDTHTNGGTVRLVATRDDMNNVGRYADLRGDDTHESRKWRITGVVRHITSPGDRGTHYVITWRGDSNRRDSVRIVHTSTLTNLY